jgi:uncharacterized SAM-binding protein YcdF (DUF218 family)
VPRRRDVLARVGWGARLIRVIGGATLAIILVGGFTPLANVFNRWMGGPSQLGPAEAIIVPGRGGADVDEVLTNRSMRRTLRAVGLYRKSLAPLLVFSGDGVEVDARVRLAQSLGVPGEHIVAAHGANTTREEAVVLERLLRPRGVARVLLVADPIDMPRTRALLQRRGFTVLGAPSASSGPGDPESRLSLLRDIGTELSAYVYYRLRGWM